MTSLTLKVFAILIVWAIGIKKADPLMVLVATVVAIPTVLLGTGVCLRALVALIG